MTEFSRRNVLGAAAAGGVFATADQGATWRPFNTGSKAEFFPNADVEYGQDPHRVTQHPLHPDRLYQQNHCGIYRMHRPDEWSPVQIDHSVPPHAQPARKRRSPAK
jgi:hypothetical protein